MNVTVAGCHDPRVVRRPRVVRESHEDTTRREDASGGGTRCRVVAPGYGA